MKFTDFTALVYKKLVRDYKTTLKLVGIFALTFVLVLTVANVVVAFAGRSFQELEAFNLLNRIYTLNEKNSIYEICNYTFLITLLFGAVCLLLIVGVATYKRTNELKTKLMMGATSLNNILEVSLENAICLILGAVLGCVLSYLIITIVSFISGVPMVFMFNILWITLLIYFVVVLFVSFITTLWVDPGKEVKGL